MARTQEDAWMEEAVEMLCNSDALQFFFQDFFQRAGMYGTPPTETELTQRAAGQRDIALEVKAVLESYHPTIYHELQIARINYLNNTSPEAENYDDDV